MECLVWLERVLQLLWIPGGDIAPPYRGLPLVILALDDSIMGSKSYTFHHSMVESMTLGHAINRTLFAVLKCMSVNIAPPKIRTLH